MSDYLVNEDKFKEFFEKKFEIELDKSDNEYIQNLSMIFANIFQSRILLNVSVYHFLLQM